MNVIIRPIWLCFWIASLFVIIAACFILTEGHIINGDYALYIAQARSLLDGTQYDVLRDMKQMLGLSTYGFYSPALYPWGFPFLLSIPFSVFGLDYFVLKIVLYICFILVLYLLAKDYCKRNEEKTGCWVILLTAFNFYILIYTNRILSELPYLLFLILALMMIRNHRPFEKYAKNKMWQAILLGGILYFTSQIRTEGFFLLPALFAHQIFGFLKKKEELNNKQIGLVLTPYLTVLFLFIVTLPLFPMGFLDHTSHFQRITDYSGVQNLLFYQGESPTLCLQIINRNQIASAFFWFLVFWGTCFSYKKAIADTVYLLVTLFILIIWPHQSLRYVFVLEPILLYFVIKGIYNLAEQCLIKHSIISFLILGFLGLSQLFFAIKGISHYNKEYKEISPNVESPNATAMFNYLRTHTRPGDVVGCAESRTIYLYTGRISCNLSASPDDTAYKADWYVEFRNRGGYLQHEPYILETNPELFREVFRNYDFIIYKIQKP